MQWFLAVLGLAIAIQAEAADRSAVWTIGSATYRYCPESRELTVTQGKATFRPLVGLGPEFLWQGMPRPLAEVRVNLIGKETDQTGLLCRYRARHGNLENQYTLCLAAAEDGLRIRVQSEATACCRVRSGKTTGSGQVVSIQLYAPCGALWPIRLAAGDVRSRPAPLRKCLMGHGSRPRDVVGGNG